MNESWRYQEGLEKIVEVSISHEVEFYHEKLKKQLIKT